MNPIQPSRIETKPMTHLEQYNQEKWEQDTAETVTEWRITLQRGGKKKVNTRNQILITHKNTKT